jgi:hypothetical protein
MFVQNEKRDPCRSIECVHQRGQAMIESLFVLALLSALIVGACAIGRLQLVALQAGSDSRLLAFSYARAGSLAHGLSGSFLPIHDAQAATGTTASAHGRVVRGHAVRFTQVGGNSALSASLRKDWHAEDGGVVTARVGVAKLSLLAGVGHAANLREAADRVTQSSSGWRAAANRSIAAGKRVTARIHSIDRGWRREKPDFNWVQPWRELLPEHVLRTPSPSGATD